MSKAFGKRVFFLVLLAMAPVGLLFAGTIDPWDTGLVKILNVLTGTTAEVIGALALVGGAIAVAVTEGQAIKRLFWVVIGVGVAIEAPSIVSLIFGVGNPSTVSGMLVWAGETWRAVTVAIGAAVVHGAHETAKIPAVAASNIGQGATRLALIAGGRLWMFS